MTDISIAPLDIGVEFPAPILFPLNIDVQLTIGVEMPIPLIANNWAGYEIGNVRLDRLTRFDLAGGESIGGPAAAQLPGVSPQTGRYYQENVEETERAFSAVAATIEVLQRTLEDVAAAQASAEEARQESAALSLEAALVNSSTSPLSVLTSYGDGRVVIADHSRVYGDGRTVSVTGATLTGFGAGDVVRPQYTDDDQLGGAVEWSSTTNTVVSQSNGLHLVGYTVIPAADDPPDTGTPSPPPGYTPAPDELTSV